VTARPVTAAVVLLWQIRAVREGSSTVVTDSIIRLLGAHRKAILNMAIPRLTNEIIDAAILGFEEQKRRLDAQLAELRAMRNGASQTAPASARPRRKMSAAGRKAIAAAQRQRWATLKGEGVAQVAPKKAKRKLSRAGRAAIVAALKKRWAAKKAAKKS
jgi:hypothetical protein